MSAATIRAATLKDYSAIARLADELQAMHVEGNSAVFQSADAHLLSEERVAEIIHKLDNVMLVSELDGQVVGFAWAYIDDRAGSEFVRAQRLVIVEMLGVDDAYQGRGIGTGLMHRIHEWGAAKDATHVQLYVWAFNGRAQAFYEAMGYEPAVISMMRKLK